MVERLIFHIGDRKSGTTSIQSALLRRIWECPTVRLIYPATFNHTGLAKAFLPKERARKPEALENRFTRVAEDIAKDPDADVAVISAEAFEDTDPQDLTAAIATHMPQWADRAEVIAYVRPHAERVVSSWAQQVKMGLTSGTLEEFHTGTLSRGRFFYAPRFGRWRDAFGDRFTLRPMVRSDLRKGDVVADFLHFALGGADYTLQGEPLRNTALSLGDLALLHRVQTGMGPNPDRERIFHDIGDHLAAYLSGTPAKTPAGAGAARARMHRALAEQTAADYREDAQTLDAEFFDGTPMADALAAAVAAAPDPAQALADQHGLSDDGLRAVTALSDMLGRMASHQPLELHRHMRRRKVKRTRTS